MTAYEYRVEWADRERVSDTDDLAAYLNTFGADGWRVVYFHDTGDLATVILLREARS